MFSERNPRQKRFLFKSRKISARIDYNFSVIVKNERGCR